MSDDLSPVEVTREEAEAIIPYKVLLEDHRLNLVLLQQVTATSNRRLQEIGDMAEKLGKSYEELREFREFICTIGDVLLHPVAQRLFKGEFFTESDY